jgi:hypothetical protein
MGREKGSFQEFLRPFTRPASQTAFKPGTCPTTTPAERVCTHLMCGLDHFLSRQDTAEHVGHVDSSHQLGARPQHSLQLRDVDFLRVGRQAHVAQHGPRALRHQLPRNQVAVVLRNRGDDLRASGVSPSAQQTMGPWSCVCRILWEADAAACMCCACYARKPPRHQVAGCS